MSYELLYLIAVELAFIIVFTLIFRRRIKFSWLNSIGFSIMLVLPVVAVFLIVSVAFGSSGGFAYGHLIVLTVCLIILLWHVLIALAFFIAAYIQKRISKRKEPQK